MWLLPLKVVFLLTLLVVGLLLALRYEAINRHYPEFMRRIEVGVIVGAVAMMYVIDWVEDGRWYVYNYTSIPSTLFVVSNATP